MIHVVNRPMVSHMPDTLVAHTVVAPCLECLPLPHLQSTHPTSATPDPSQLPWRLARREFDVAITPKQLDFQVAKNCREALASAQRRSAERASATWDFFDDSWSWDLILESVPEDPTFPNLPPTLDYKEYSEFMLQKLPFSSKFRLQAVSRAVLGPVLCLWYAAAQLACNQGIVSPARTTHLLSCTRVPTVPQNHSIRGATRMSSGLCSCDEVCAS